MNSNQWLTGLASGGSRPSGGLDAYDYDKSAGILNSAMSSIPVGGKDAYDINQWAQRNNITQRLDYSNGYEPNYTSYAAPSNNKINSSTTQTTGGTMDLGNYNLGNNYEYSPVDPSTSKLKGLMTTDYAQLRKDLQTPGEMQINQTFDKADYTNRDIMGGGGLYGSSIYGDTINQSALNRGNALASNAAQAGATVAGLQSQENQWLGDSALKESQMQNTWNLSQDTLDKGLVHDLILAELGNKYALEQIGASGRNNIDYATLMANANEDAASSGAWGSLGGVALKGLMDNWGSIFG